MLKGLGLLFLMILSFGQGALAQTAQSIDPDDQQAVVRVIEQQLSAFRIDDGAKAFSFASPHIQSLFQTPERFMAMVKSGYRAVYRPQVVEFLDGRQAGGRTAQAVRFIGPDGKAVIAIYEMEQQPDGTWRINGVQLVDTGEVGS
ncbi:MAG: DUF4864 domain-containing protein [Pseudomonadota bacterium]